MSKIEETGVLVLCVLYLSRLIYKFDVDLFF